MANRVDTSRTTFPGASTGTITGMTTKAPAMTTQSTRVISDVTIGVTSRELLSFIGYFCCNDSSQHRTLRIGFQKAHENLTATNKQSEIYIYVQATNID